MTMMILPRPLGKYSPSIPPSQHLRQYRWKVVVAF